MLSRRLISKGLKPALTKFARLHLYRKKRVWWCTPVISAIFIFLTSFPEVTINFFEHILTFSGSTRV
jgi:hypothetical protein